MSRAIRTLYRLFLRQATVMEKQGISIDVQMPMDKMAWLQNGGGHGWATPAPAYMKESLVGLLPWLSSSTYTGTFNAEQLRQTIRAEFRHPSNTDSSTNARSTPTPTPTALDLLDRAFTSLRILEEQLHMARCSSTATTKSVRVDVCSAFVGTQAELDPTYDPDDEAVPPKMYYTYRVRVSNTGNQTVQLKSRHWIIKNAAGQIMAEVARGARGVVGCTPILKPATCFQYFSGTDSDPSGGTTMQGSFEMAVLNSKTGLTEKTFDAEIAPFTFLPPRGFGTGDGGDQNE
ncbi:hypothetical protein Ndes2526B_g09289 [Nannochloris sp. 'desiccata']|nr:hypothetical protein KSW81_003681 [Chlorella desiccata (nom. nud.)]KAH7615975.1 putative Protein ApaG [Chlorella desiccata (nom. nud.)]